MFILTRGTRIEVELLLIDGRNGRIRTYDPLVPNQVRYQAALRSVFLCALQRLLNVSMNPLPILFCCHCVFLSFQKQKTLGV